MLLRFLEVAYLFLSFFFLTQSYVKTRVTSLLLFLPEVKWVEPRLAFIRN